MGPSVTFGRRLKILCCVFTVLASAYGCDSDTIGEAKNGRLSLEPSQGVILPKIGVGELHASTFVITNLGAGVLNLVQVRADFSNGDEFDVLWYPGGDPGVGLQDGFVDGASSFPPVINIQPNEQVSFVVRYTPLAVGTPEGGIRMETNDPDHLTYIVPITGSDIGAELRLSDTELDFGRVGVGEAAEHTVIATNFGTSTLHLSTLRVLESDNYRVEVDGLDISTNSNLLEDPDQNGSPGLEPGEQFEILVRYTAISPEQDVGTLIFGSNAMVGDSEVLLIGNADSPCIRLEGAAIIDDPETGEQVIDFGVGLIGRTNPEEIRIVSCGVEPLRLDAITMGDEGGFSVREESLPELPGSLPPAELDTLPPRYPDRAITLVFEPGETAAYESVLTIETNDRYRPTLNVPVMGEGADNDCPTAVVADPQWFVRPLDLVELDGSTSVDPDGPNSRPVRFEWTVIERPMGSTSTIVEEVRSIARPEEGGFPDMLSTPQAQFFVDLAGTYVLELRVTDNLGTSSPSEACDQEPARVTIEAIPDAPMHLQLVWETQSDLDLTDELGTDLDLHLRHPTSNEWFSAADCYFGNATPDWGIVGNAADDPSLDIDDTNGAGPENINLWEPENTNQHGAPYRVGVHYYRSFASNFGGDDLGASTAMVRVYLNGEVVHSASRSLGATNDFWEVVDIEWDDIGPDVSEVDNLFQLSPF